MREGAGLDNGKGFGLDVEGVRVAEHHRADVGHGHHVHAAAAVADAAVAAAGVRNEGHW